MDFYKIRIRESSKGIRQAYPDWIVDNSEDLMVRGGAFYAIWDEERSMWSTDEFDVQRKVDAEVLAFVDEHSESGPIEALLTRNFSTGLWEKFQRFVRSIPEGNFYPLDECLTFANSEVGKKDYRSKRLPYALEPGNTDSWDELMGVLYSEIERDKIEWTIGAIIAGDSKWLQKFLVFYGPPASGKSTIIGVIERLFAGYLTTFEAKALTGSNSTFSMEMFEHNPLVAIQHDGDLSRIEDNSKINSIVGHDIMTINMKYRSPFSIRLNTFLIMGTNKPVKITDAKAGNTRRLIDVHPTGAHVDPGRYHILLENINYELGAIADKCLKRYYDMGKFYYENYIPTQMMQLTDSFYNFIEANYDIFKSEEAFQLRRVWEMYKEYCEEANIIKRLQRHEVRDELNSYFEEFRDRYFSGEKEFRSVYLGFKGLPQQGPAPVVPDTSYVVELGNYDITSNPSNFDKICAKQPAQEANRNGFPKQAWSKVTTSLADIDSTKLHYVQIPENHIVIDFDLRDESGEKNLELNLTEASKFPPTYTELSQSGKGIHLHYIYNGDVTELESKIGSGVEIKTLLGDSALRRKLTMCNNLAISTISGGLPKKEKKVLKSKSIQTEKGLRTLIVRNLRKEIHAGTKPSIDFIYQILDDAYNMGMAYDVTDMRPDIIAFAANSTNQAKYCINLVQQMKFVGKQAMPDVEGKDGKPIVFFDVEVYPNLFVVCWKYQDEEKVVRMINPKADDVEMLFKMKLVGFNNRRYDNHILYARFLGYSIEQLFELSQRIIFNTKYNNQGLFGEAYNLSYADIFDFSSKKQSLKKFQIDLGIHHQELDLPWDKPVHENDWKKVEDYCVNDVVSAEAVFNDRYQDFIARQILSELSGLSVNHTTQQHTAKIIFGDDKNPQNSFVYTDLSEEFPGYVFDGKESTYGEEITGEGGYVYSEPGYYEKVAVLDIASMHPTSIEQLNLFGPYTEKFRELKAVRIAIKHKDYDTARVLLDGRIDKYLDNPEHADNLSYALKIILNSVYGYTSAHFPSMFKDNRNKDNIVAKRGALFMIDLKHAVQQQNYIVAHIKTDSIKIPNADPQIIQFVIDFGEEYGYTFEHECTYDKFCLINDAVYIASDGGEWTAVGAQFQHPYVFKTLFSHDDIEFNDMCETKAVKQGVMYLDTLDSDEIEDMRFLGTTGSFVPVDRNGGTLWRVKDGKKYAVTGTKGYRWIERDVAAYREPLGELSIDMRYFERLQEDAIKAIENFVRYEDFVS